MSNANPQIDRLKALLGLEEKRAELQELLDDVHQQISALQGRLYDRGPFSTPASKASGKASKGAPARKGRAQRGALKDQVMAALESAGHEGVRVSELAATLGTKAANLHAWFHSTAKRISAIEKISGGHYRLNGKVSASEKAPARAAKSSSSRSTKVAKRGKSGGSKRGELAAGILSSLEDAGSEGLSIKELAEKTGVKYRNISIWFATTGKKSGKVKKVGPARYKLA